MYLIYSTGIFIIFQDNSSEHWCICNLFIQVQKFHHVRNEALAFATTHEQRLPLPQYYGISNLQNVSSVAKTSESLAGKGQDNRGDIPDDPTEMTTINLSSKVCCVALQRHDEAPHLTTDIQICSCKQSHAVIAVCHKERNFMCMTPSTSQDTDARRFTAYKHAWKFLVLRGVGCFHSIPPGFAWGVNWCTCFTAR
jgi:hypothetical protein